MKLDYNNMGSYDTKLLLTLMVDTAVEMRELTIKRVDLEKKHPITYTDRTDWQDCSTQYIENQYKYLNIYNEIIRRCGEND